MKTSVRYWKTVLREAERELQAATGRTILKSAARNLMQARAELKRPKAEASA